MLFGWHSVISLWLITACLRLGARVTGSPSDQAGLWEHQSGPGSWERRLLQVRRCQGFSGVDHRQETSWR